MAHVNARPLYIAPARRGIVGSARTLRPAVTVGML